MQTVTRSPGRMFMIVAIIAVLWNLLGVFMFIMQVTLSPAAIASMPAAQQAVYQAIPVWTNIAFGVAVLSGLVGSVGLLLKKRWAVPVFALSLLAVLVQAAGNYMSTPLWQVTGPSGLVMPLLVAAIALYLWRYAANAARHGWLH
ncbi:hypothetical protein [Pseudoxanthomonas dokdonensis]|uniref:Sugar transporter n=1 Tax=Pseudoxanthomonas dokdonensis TaxID=344882 RepID=A0A0R0CW32_9GAMM|nr:hypothetical protein [Pseudoxanthomonas dokdonensis]KRG69985.1 hypothetical protein ABB29_07005 [Pseudoxanthomonas dokdonensis]